MKELPMLAVFNDDLTDQPSVDEHSILLHRHEDGTWEEAKHEYGYQIIQSTVNNVSIEKKVPSKALGFYELKNGKTYLASIQNKLMKRDNLKLK